MLRQQQFRRSPRPLLVCDDARVVIDANPAACLLLRMPPDALVGRGLGDLVVGGDRVRLEAGLPEEGAPPEERRVDAVALRPPDGGRLVVDVTCTPNVAPGRHLLALDFPSEEPRAEASPVLSDREREVLTQVALGRTGQAIAAELFVSPATVESHVSRAVAKLDARNRPHAVALALRAGELDPGSFVAPRSAREEDDGRTGAPDLRQVSIDAVPEPVAVVDASGAILAVNAAWTAVARRHGAEATTGPGASYLDVCDRAPRDAVGAAEVAWGLREVLEDRCDRFTTEYAFETDDGLRWCEARVVRYAGDGPVRAIVRHHDVTARHVAETDAHLARSVLDEVDAAVVLLSVEGTVRDWRAGAPVIFGWGAEEAEGRPLAEVVVDPRDAPVLDASLGVVGRRGHWSGELRLLRRDGRFFDAHVRHGLLRGADGATLGIVTVVVDETARVQAQRALLAARDRLRAVAAIMAEGLVSLDAFGHVIDANATAAGLLGWSREELRGRHLAEVVRTPGDRATGLRVPRDGAVRRVDEETLLRRDGSPVAVSYAVAPFDAGEGASGAVVVLREVLTDDEDAVRRRARDEARTLRLLREALDEDRVLVHGQAVVALRAGRTVRQVLLPRIAGADGGLQGFERFLPVAREHGLARRVDRRVLVAAAAQAGAGRAVELDVCAETAVDPSFPASVGSELEAAGADPALLTLAVAGEAFGLDEGAATTLVRRAAALGCPVALQGFGAGPIALAVLRAVPWSEVQLDVAFAAGLREDDRARAAVRGVVGLARGFGLRTAAVGVDDGPTRDLLAELDVDLGRGDALGAPGPLPGADGAAGAR